MNMNELAAKLAKNEGLKKSMTIAQIKEVLKFTAIICSDSEETLKKFLTYGKRASKRYATKGK